MTSRTSSAGIALLIALVCSLTASVSHAAKDVLIPQGSIWRYLDDGSDAGTAWTAVSFDDSSWAQGPAQLGYAGRAGQATVVSFGPDPNNKYATTYFRYSFDVANPAAYTNLTLRLLRDDAAIAYLNGVEIHRDNLTSGAVDYQTESLHNVRSDEEFELFYTDVDPSLLIAGTNTISVEVHRWSLSSDLAFDLELIAGDAARTPEVVRGPYIQQIAPTQATIRWRTDIATRSAVRFGASPGALGSTALEFPKTIEHEVDLTGLTPDSRVFYSVGHLPGELVGNDVNHFFDLPPSAPIGDPVRIWVTGDAGTANYRSKAVRDAYIAEGGANITDLWIMLGDSAYTDGTDDQFEVAVYNVFPTILRNTPVFATLGNHEGHTADSATQTGAHYENWTLPKMAESGGLASGTEAYYSFDYDNIHFICLDSQGSDRSPGGPMFTWLEADLEDTQQKWIIAFWHHPPYSHGSHDSDTESQLSTMRENAVPILEAGGVDLILAGHSHSYERSMLIDGHYGDSSTFDASMTVDAGTGDPLGSGAYSKPDTVGTPHAGAVYAVAGSGGQTKSAPLTHPIMVTSLVELGSLVIDVVDGSMTVRFLNDQGATLDRFAIEKVPFQGVGVPALTGTNRIVLAGALIFAAFMLTSFRRAARHRAPIQ